MQYLTIQVHPVATDTFVNMKRTMADDPRTFYYFNYLTGKLGRILGIEP